MLYMLYYIGARGEARRGEARRGGLAWLRLGLCPAWQRPGSEELGEFVRDLGVAKDLDRNKGGPK